VFARFRCCSFEGAEEAAGAGGGAWGWEVLPLWETPLCVRRHMLRAPACTQPSLQADSPPQLCPPVALQFGKVVSPNFTVGGKSYTYTLEERNAFLKVRCAVLCCAALRCAALHVSHGSTAPPRSCANSARSRSRSPMQQALPHCLAFNHALSYAAGCLR